MSVEKPTLPALVIEVSGLVKSSNLGIFRDKALEVIGAIPSNPETDEDFVQAEIDAKWCGEIKAQLKAAKEAAIQQTEDISTLFALIDEVAKIAGEKESSLLTSIKSRKDAIKDQIVHGASLKLQEYLKTLNVDLPKGCQIYCPPPVLFKEAMKGKKTVKGCRDAVQELYNEEMQKACDIYGVTLTNWKALEGKEHLMRDFSSHCRKPPEDFLEILAGREKEEALRLENERLKQDAEIAAKQKQISEQIEAKRTERERAAAQTIIEEAAAESVTVNADAPEVVAAPIKPAATPIISDSARESASLINAFMRTRDFGEERWKIKSILVEFEKFKANQMAQEAA